MKISVPQNVIQLDTVKTGKEFEALHRKKQQKRSADDGDEDSDAEEERLIEEAEQQHHPSDERELDKGMSLSWLGSDNR